MGVIRPMRRSDISARRMAVRPDVPWYWRWLRIAAGGVLLLIVAWAFVEARGGFGGVREGDAARELTRLNERLERLERELAYLRADVTKSDRQLQIERAATADLAKQVKSMTFDNAALREDLAFFQSLMSSATGGREGTLSVNRFRLQPEAVAGEYHYQMLLVQTGQRVAEFHGKLQFVLEVQQDGRKLVLVLPPEGDREAKDYQLNFKFFQRVEGTFKLTPGSVLKGMQVRVFENGVRTPKLTQVLNIS
jgi:hypothetical protein